MSAMTGAHRFDDHLMAEINITPFADVLLVLLVIFMILAAFVAPPGFQKRFEPAANHAPNRPVLQSIEVSVTATGAVFIDAAPTSGAGLYRAMAAAVHAHTHRVGFSRHVALTAAGAAPYAVIIRILDAARQAGDDDVGFVTY
jgi:biopolymer transport protein ExbD